MAAEPTPAVAALRRGRPPAAASPLPSPHTHALSTVHANAIASQLRLHLAATPPLLLPHRRRPHLPLLPLRPTLNPIQAGLPALPVPRVLSHARPVRAVGGGVEPKEGVVAEGEEPLLVGEDSAAFELKDQSAALWAYFTGILAAVLVGLNVLWIDPGTRVGTKFLDAIAFVSDSHEAKTWIPRSDGSSLFEIVIQRASVEMKPENHEIRHEFFEEI